MYKNIIVVLSLFALVFASQAAFRASAIADSELNVPSNGQITLGYLNGVGYAAQVDFSVNSGQFTPMLISLYTSSVLFTSNCLQFSKYSCAQYSTCSKDSKLYNVAYPSFIAQGNMVKTVAILDSNNWQLSPSAPTLLTQGCTSANSPVGTGAYGVLGLGFEGAAQQNFKNMVSTFGISYAMGAFRLQFSPNMNFPKNQIAKVRTDANWKVQNVESIAIGSTLYRPPQNIKAIFDLNADTIGFPVDIFNMIIPGLSNLRIGITCQTGVLYQPICNYGGRFSDLPNLSVNPDSITNILLSPAMYTSNFNGASFTLNLRALAPTLSGLNYVTPDFANTIILGNTVLGNFYSLFNTNERSVTLYQML